MIWKILASLGLVLHCVTLVVIIWIARSEHLPRAIALTLAAPFISAIATLFLIALFLLIIVLSIYHIPRRSIAFLSSRMKSLKRLFKPDG